MTLFPINLQRIIWLLRQQIAEHWKTHLRYYLALQAVFLVALFTQLYSAFGTFSDFTNIDEIMASSLYSMSISMATIGNIAIFCAFIFSATSILALPTQHAKRIVELMIPATTVEKVISRFIHFNLGSVFLAFMALIITDIFGYLVVEAYDFDYIWFIPNMLSKMGENMTISLNTIVEPHPLLGDWTIEFLPLCTLFALWSIYFWGGAFFRKKSFIMTSLICFVSFVIFFMTTIFIILGDIDLASQIHPAESMNYTLNFIFTIYWIIGFVWLMLNLYWGYRIRKHASLVPRHWYGQ